MGKKSVVLWMEDRSEPPSCRFSSGMVFWGRQCRPPVGYLHPGRFGALRRIGVIALPGRLSYRFSLPNDRTETRCRLKSLDLRTSWVEFFHRPPPLVWYNNFNPRMHFSEHGLFHPQGERGRVTPRPFKCPAFMSLNGRPPEPHHAAELFERSPPPALWCVMRA